MTATKRVPFSEAVWLTPDHCLSFSYRVEQQQPGILETSTEVALTGRARLPK